MNDDASRRRGSAARKHSASRWLAWFAISTNGQGRLLVGHDGGWRLYTAPQGSVRVAALVGTRLYLVSGPEDAAVLTVRDLAAGHVHVDRAAGHLLLLAGTLAVAAMAWRQRPHRPGWSATAWSVRSWALGRTPWLGHLDTHGHRAPVRTRLHP